MTTPRFTRSPASGIRICSLARTGTGSSGKPVTGMRTRAPLSAG